MFSIQRSLPSNLSSSRSYSPSFQKRAGGDRFEKFGNRKQEPEDNKSVFWRTLDKLKKELGEETYDALGTQWDQVMLAIAEEVDAPLEFARVIEKMLQKEPQRTETILKEHFAACPQEGVNELLNKGESGETTLLMAAINTHSPLLIDCLLNKFQPDVNRATEMLGTTAMHEACAQGDLELVQKLIQAGAVIDVTDKVGITPLMVAAGAFQDCTSLLQYLIEQKQQDIRQQDLKHKNALSHAIEAQRRSQSLKKDIQEGVQQNLQLLRRYYGVR